MNSTLQVRIDSKTKHQVKKILDKLGLDFSSAIKLYFYQIQRTKNLPFIVRTENGYTPEFEQEIVRQLAEMKRERKAGKAKLYKSSREWAKDIGL